MGSRSNLRALSTPQHLLRLLRGPTRKTPPTEERHQRILRVLPRREPIEHGDPASSSTVPMKIHPTQPKSLQLLKKVGKGASGHSSWEKKGRPDLCKRLAINYAASILGFCWFSSKIQGERQTTVTELTFGLISCLSISTSGATAGSEWLNSEVRIRPRALSCFLLFHLAHHRISSIMNIIRATRESRRPDPLKSHLPRMLAVR